MHRNKYFTHINISGDDYLLPTAQSISDHKRGIRISETGALIWSLLKPGIDCPALIDDFTTKAGISDTDKDDAAQDVKLFLDHLVKLGIVYNDNDTEVNADAEDTDNVYDCSKGTWQTENCDPTDNATCNAYPAFYEKPVHELMIAGITIDVYGKKEYFAPSFDSFKREKSNTSATFRNDGSFHDPGNKGADSVRNKADLRIAVTESPCTASSGTYNVHSHTIIRNKEMNISETDREYIISYPEASQVMETRIDKESFDTVISIRKDHTGTDMYDPDSLVYQLFHAIRIPFLYAAEQKGLYAIHSVSILYREKAWLFSASSGTGKSTHAALWTDNTSATNINGDLNLIGIDDGQATVYGLPWCGTSEIYDTHSYPLGGVIFLKRSPTDRLEDITGSERVITLTRRSISPVWNSMALQKMISDLIPITDSVYIKRLHCTKEISAQKLLQESIDSYLCRR